MKCISKCNYLKRMFSITILGILLFSVLTGCGQIQKYEIPYTADSEVSSFRVIEFTNEKNTADPFAKDLCVSESNYRADAIDLSNASGGALFDVNNHETIYAKNIYEKEFKNYPRRNERFSFCGVFGNGRCMRQNRKGIYKGWF